MGKNLLTAGLVVIYHGHDVKKNTHTLNKSKILKPCRVRYKKSYSTHMGTLNSKTWAILQKFPGRRCSAFCTNELYIIHTTVVERCKLYTMNRCIHWFYPAFRNNHHQDQHIFSRSLKYLGFWDKCNPNLRRYIFGCRCGQHRHFLPPDRFQVSDCGTSRPDPKKNEVQGFKGLDR